VHAHKEYATRRLIQAMRIGILDIVETPRFPRKVGLRLRAP
jgi:hypothetical protein